MSRKIWMDRTIEAAREADIRMPWSRGIPAPQPTQEPLPLRAKG